MLFYERCDPVEIMEDSGASTSVPQYIKISVQDTAASGTEEREAVEVSTQAWGAPVSVTEGPSEADVVMGGIDVEDPVCLSSKRALGIPTGHRLRAS